MPLPSAAFTRTIAVARALKATRALSPTRDHKDTRHPDVIAGRALPAPQNWACNFFYNGVVWRNPRNMQDLQKIVQKAKQCRALGGRHSFNRCADTTGEHISLEGIEPCDLELDERDRTVTCSAWLTWAQLAAQLEERGWALPAMPSWPHLSVGGSLATAAHGSGDTCTSLLTSLVSLDYVDANGELVCGNGAFNCKGAVFDPTLQAMLLSGFGIVVEVTLRIEPSYKMRVDVYTDLPWTCVEERGSSSEKGAGIDEIFAEAQSVSIFTDFVSFEGVDQAWFKRRVPTKPDGSEGTLPAAPESLFGGKLATQPMHPVPQQPAEMCSPQGEPAGPWSERLPHFHAGVDADGRGEELHGEYFVHRDDAAAAIAAVRNVGTRAGSSMKEVLRVAEIRSVAADELWLSPAYRRPSLAIHFTWKTDTNERKRKVNVVVYEVEAALAPFGPRPHWGGFFLFRPEVVATMYPMMPAYREVIEKLDPTGKFRNSFVDQFVFGIAAAEEETTTEEHACHKGAEDVVEGAPAPDDNAIPPLYVDDAPFPAYDSSRAGRAPRAYDLLVPTRRGRTGPIALMHRSLGEARPDDVSGVPKELAAEQERVASLLRKAGGAVRYDHSLSSML